MTNLTDSINNILPQTQCTLCGYQGCKPYAEAIALNGEAINRCLPGGIRVLNQIATMTNQDATPYLEEMKQKSKSPSIALIREAECIGCTKCISACPVDAIIGASKQMHTVITDVCTGCGLCIPPCPVDCIDLITIAEKNEETWEIDAQQARERYEKQQRRLSRDKTEKKQNHEQAKISSFKSETLQTRKNAIAEAIARSKNKKNS